MNEEETAKYRIVFLITRLTNFGFLQDCEAPDDIVEWTVSKITNKNVMRSQRVRLRNCRCEFQISCWDQSGAVATVSV
ncbi:hypothetical protein L596_022503 [Steinernema carpocapsae]|uniref:Uncharacterized protein n=1 Tax=Steinernema carpocapsae TaxID=34508 RepID=A0A4U5MLY0_STECR|nr:hypothetical protein L596_022503 [Steinernema carpocapsae]